MLGLRGASAGVAILAVACFAGCGSTTSDPAAVRVGGTPISKAAVDHWIAVATVGGATGSGRHDHIRQQVLELLIGWQWLIQEAARKGLRVSTQELEQRLHEHELSSFPGGETEMESFLKAAGQTVSDLKLQATAELAGEKLTRALASRVPPVTPAEVEDYYRRHEKTFVPPESREVLITNRKSYAAAEQAKRQAQAGELAAAEFSPEVRELPNDPSAGARPVLEAAIRRAAVGTIGGPVKQLAVGTVYDYFVFKLERVIRPPRPTIAAIRAVIKRRLEAEAKTRETRQFVSAWRAKWTVETDCSPGYVVQKCRQYKGPMEPESQTKLE